MPEIGENCGSPDKHESEEDDLAVYCFDENKGTVERLIKYEAELAAFLFDTSPFNWSAREDVVACVHRGLLGKQRPSVPLKFFGG